MYGYVIYSVSDHSIRCYIHAIKYGQQRSQLDNYARSSMDACVMYIYCNPSLGPCGSQFIETRWINKMGLLLALDKYSYIQEFHPHKHSAELYITQQGTNHHIMIQSTLPLIRKFHPILFHLKYDIHKQIQGGMSTFFHL